MGLFGFGKKNYLKFVYGASLYKFSFDKCYCMDECNSMWVGICVQARKVGINLDWTTLNTIAHWISRCKNGAGWVDACGNAAINFTNDFTVESDGLKESQMIKAEIQKARDEVGRGNPTWWTREVSREYLETLITEYSIRKDMF